MNCGAQIEQDEVAKDCGTHVRDEKEVQMLQINVTARDR